MAQGYDAILFVSFGGPEGMADVMPFLENVLRGRNVPRERMMEVAHHYEQFGGVSPINEQNRALIKEVVHELREHGCDLPVYWGNRNWDPLLPDTLATMRDDGVKRALGFFTSAFSSYSGCRQYRENVLLAQDQVGQGTPQVDKLRMFFNHPGFIEAMVDRVNEARATLSKENQGDVQLVFTAHSIPSSMATTSAYEAQLKEACELVAKGAGVDDHVLVYQSRSGPPTQPWLEPDVCDYLEGVFGESEDQSKRNAVVIVPIGFISDHMEVIYDLDYEAAEVCERMNVPMARAGTAGTHSSFVRMIRQLIEERLSDSHERIALGQLGACHDVCPTDCCPPPAARPAR
jgi:protoporphyrin/coproporphyrin ferrochelatase